MAERIPHEWSLALYRWIGKIRPAPLAVLVKKLVRVQRVSLPTHEGTFWIDPVSTFGLALLQYGEYEARTAKILRALLLEGSTFVDLGANEGYFSVVASKLVGSSGRVYAVEPQQRLQGVVSHNLDLNNVRNTWFRGCAIGKDVGEMPLYLSPDTNSGSSGFYRSTKYRLKVQTTQTLTLDEFFARENLATCDLMKMDIEGAEYEAIMGSPDIFTHGKVRALILETHPDVLSQRGRDANDIAAFLKRCGYAVDSQFPESGVWRCQAGSVDSESRGR